MVTNFKEIYDSYSRYLSDLHDIKHVAVSCAYSSQYNRTLLAAVYAASSMQREYYNTLLNDADYSNAMIVHLDALDNILALQDYSTTLSCAVVFLKMLVEDYNSQKGE